jgi:hypothetical protein
MRRVLLVIGCLLVASACGGRIGKRPGLFGQDADYAAMNLNCAGDLEALCPELTDNELKVRCIYRFSTRVSEPCKEAMHLEEAYPRSKLEQQ